MASSSVVLVQPGRKGRRAVGVAGEDPPVGPLGGEGAVEPLHLPVLPGAVRPDELVCGPRAVMASLTSLLLRQLRWLSVMTRSMAVMPWVAKCVAARRMNAAQVGPLGLLHE